MVLKMEEAGNHDYYCLHKDMGWRHTCPVCVHSKKRKTMKRVLVYLMPLCIVLVSSAMYSIIAV